MNQMENNQIWVSEMESRQWWNVAALIWWLNIPPDPQYAKPLQSCFRSEDVDEDTDDILATDDAAHGWLESMGLDKKQFPSLDPKKVKLYP